MRRKRLFLLPCNRLREDKLARLCTCSDFSCRASVYLNRMDYLWTPWRYAYLVDADRADPKVGVKVCPKRWLRGPVTVTASFVT